MIRNPIVRQPLAALLLGLTLGGCTNWHVQTGSPSQIVRQPSPGMRTPPHTIRVQKRDGEIVEIDQPKVVGDSIRGVLRKVQGEPIGAVALSDVSRVETPQSDDVAAAIGIVLLVSAFALVVHQLQRGW